MAAAMRHKPEDGLRLKKPSRLREFLEDVGQAAALAQSGFSGPDLGVSAPGVERKKIVVVSTDAEFSPALVSHALSVAGRLGTEVVALSIGSQSQTGDDHARKARELFEMRAIRSGENFGLQASQAGVPFRHVVRFGKAAEVVEGECGRLRRVEFVLACKEQRGRDGLHVSMPLFEVVG
jgi:hypothetical protein